MALRSNTRSKTRVRWYELGRTLGKGNFAKVKFARNVETGENFAIKVLDKEKVLKHKMIGQLGKSQKMKMFSANEQRLLRVLCLGLEEEGHGKDRLDSV
ncbi:hypothetical protein ACFXTN_003329 [Malus domestica]